MNIEEAMREGVEDAKVISISEALGPEMTHDGLALDLGECWREYARYCAPWNRWLFFAQDAGVWRIDDRLEHMTRARAFLRDRAADIGGNKGDRLRNADTVAKVVGLARSNVAQAATTEQWDADPWLLGTPAGTVDLKTGKLRGPSPEDYITKTTAVAPAAPGTPAPIWLAHLDRITDGNDELVAYHKRFFGYALTGSIREHVFSFAHGGGGNGKGVTYNTALGILADYALSIPSEMLMISRGDRHPEELARLRGVRLAIGSETEEGTRWAEAKIKRLTGGDPIAARHMRQNTFEFEPQFKLVVFGNKRPQLRGVDEAMRRRLHFVPFTVTISADERDVDLPEKLRDEWPAILRWMIDGCLEYQRDGLNPPDLIRAATDDYLEAEDSLSMWVEECTDLDANAWEATGSLYASWKHWAERGGEFVGTKRRFAGIMVERDFTKKRQSGTGTHGFLGLRLKASQDHTRWSP